MKLLDAALMAAKSPSIVEIRSLDAPQRMAVYGPSRWFAASQRFVRNLRHSGLTSNIANPIAVVQTPYPPADLNARGAVASRMQQQQAACRIGQQHVHDN
jgi:hypothetical protein